MQGWSQYKQGRLEDSLKSFFGVLDLKVAGQEGREAASTALAGLTRADRELVEDTFRVASISLANLQGAESIPPFIDDSPARKTYEFRVYEQLGELYIKQERTKDAADTFDVFARKHPLHAQAPVMQARVIEIYEKSGFANQAIEAKKEYVARYGVASEFRRANPEGWDKAQPLVKTRLAELARHYHASAQKTKASADYQEAVRWYREYLASFPTDPAAAQSNFLLAELLFEDKPLRRGERRVREDRLRLPEAREERRRRLRRAARLRCSSTRRRRPPSSRRCSARPSPARSASPQAFPADPRNGPVLDRRRREALRAAGGRPGRAVAQRVVELQAAGGRGAAPRRLDRARHTVVRGERLRRRREGVRRGAQAHAREGRRRATTWSSARRRRSTSRASSARAAGKHAGSGGALRPRRHGRAAVDRARQRAVRRRGVADRAQGLGRRDQDPRGLPRRASRTTRCSPR